MSPTKMEPPRSGRARTFTHLLESCMDGDWWLVREYKVASTAYSTAYHLKPGGRLAHQAPEGEWEFRAGAVPGSGYGVWARYLGKKR